MRFKIRTLADDVKLTDQSLLEALEAGLPFQVVKEVVDAHCIARKRQRKLTVVMGVLLAVAMNLWARQSLSRVLIKLIKGYRFIWPSTSPAPASKGAISQLRYEIGAKPLEILFHKICRPMATVDTPGAYLGPFRLMAIDGTVEDMPDTPENVAVFGRHTSGRGDAAFPQVKSVYLCELGTHAIVDCGFYPVHTSEHKGARRLTRSIEPDMLVMWDAGLHSYDLVKKTLGKGAQALSRIPETLKLEPVARLDDGSYLAYLRPSEPKRRRAGEHILVRVIEYTIDDPTLPGYKKRHRLITTLLDAPSYPALMLARRYHERWEIELSIDEIDTHQRLAERPLRSLKPVGVLQELYGLLIAHYLVRKVIHDAAVQVGWDPDRISFINALELICDAIPEFQMLKPKYHAERYQRLLEDIRAFKLPPRENRWNPRVVKRKMSNFPKKRPHHYKKKPLKKPFQETIVILN